MNGLQGRHYFVKEAHVRASTRHLTPDRTTTAKPGHALARPGHCLVEENSDVEAELHDVAVFHDVVLAFHADLTGSLRGCQGTGLDQIVV